MLERGYEREIDQLKKELAAGRDRGSPERRRDDSARQRQRAAYLIATGATQQEAADAVGVSKRTVTRWARREDVQAEITRIRGRTPATEAGADSVLAAALGATDRRGHPDWRIRLQAAGMIKRFRRDA